MRLRNIILLVSKRIFAKYILLNSLFYIGMNDILPKPFTKEGLLDMLEVSRSLLVDPEFHRPDFIFFLFFFVFVFVFLFLFSFSFSFFFSFFPIGGGAAFLFIETSYAPQSYATNDSDSTIGWGSSTFRCEFRTGVDDECYDHSSTAAAATVATTTTSTTFTDGDGGDGGGSGSDNDRASCQWW